jgi:DNA repair protein RadA/Sms
MAKSQLRFVCQACGSAYGKWSGRCDNCGEWNSLAEETVAAPLPGAKGAGLPKGRAGRLVPLKGDEAPLKRI